MAHTTRLIERLLNLQPGDLNRGGSLFAYLFLVIASYVVGKAARSALFLGEYAAVNLPYVTIAIAVLVGVVVAVYVRIARRTTLRNLLVWSLACFSSTAVGFWYVAHFHKAAWLYPAFYVWVGIYGVLAPAQVWTLANDVLTTRQAKRLFGLVGSGAISGFIFGGFLTRQLVGRFGAESVLLAMAILSMSCIVPVVLVFRRTSGAAGAALETEAQLAQAGLASLGDDTFLQSLRLVSSSAYLRSIAAVICLSSIATTTANWQFEAFTQAQFAMNKDAIGRFLGDFYFFAGIACLLFQLLVTSRLLRRFGIGPALFVVPLALLGGSIAILVWGTLSAAVLLRASDQILRYSIDKSTVELLYLPVAPGVKLAVKAFIDTVVWRLGDGLSGILVLGLVTWGGTSARQVSWMNIVIIAAWAAAALRARREYVETLRESIQQHRLDAARTSAPVLDRSATDMLADRLHATDPQEILYALGLLELGRQQVTHPAVRGLLDHPTPEVRQRAIAILNAAGDTGVKASVESLLLDPYLEVRTEALLYLSRHAHLDPLIRIEELGDFADFSIRAALVAYLTHPGPSQNLEAARVLFEGMVADPGPQSKRGRMEAARLIGRFPDLLSQEFPDPHEVAGPEGTSGLAVGGVQALRLLIADRDPDVAAEAARAAGRSGSPLFLLPLLERIGDRGLADVVAEALGRFGNAVVGTLRDHLADVSVRVETRQEIPAILARIGTREAARALSEALLDANTQLRFRVIQALNKIYEAHPEIERDVGMIETVLAAEVVGHYRSYQILGLLGETVPGDEVLVRAPRESMDREVERIFRLLGLLYPRHDLHSACVGVQSLDPVAHDNALEFLDNILKPQLRSVLVPLLDSSVSASERVRLASRAVGMKIESREQAVRALLLSEEPWLKSCGAYAVGTLGLRELQAELDLCLEHPDPLLRETARQAKIRLQM
jgi:AAA family ATP:ADP antiporter